MSIIAMIGQLEAIFGQPNEASTVKVELRGRFYDFLRSRTTRSQGGIHLRPC